MEIPKQIQDKFAQFQNLQNQLQMISLQKQQLMLANTDMENALKALEKQEKGAVYRMVGPILVQTNKEDGLSYLNGERESAETKVKVLERQEKKFVEKLNSMKTELESMMRPPGA